LDSFATIAIALALGSVPTAYLLGRWLGGIDIRGRGNRNPGALNAYRQIGKVAGAAVLLVDAGKGALSIYIGQTLGAPDAAVYGAGVMAIVGHNFSPFLRFRGGKGAATALGISAIMLWQVTALSVAAGALLLSLTRHPVWSLTGVFVLLNALTIATSQPAGQIAVCLAISALVAGTHLYRQSDELLPALRQGRWRRFMSTE
jgi:glycerol-3-phosphate acyltransferase PlsY